MRYTTILFDADDTLFDFKKAEYTALDDTLNEYNIPHSDCDIAEYSVINERTWKSFERGEIRRSEIGITRFGAFLKYIGRSDIDTVSFNKQYSEHLSHNCFLFNGTISLLDALKPLYSMYMITNGTSRVQHGRLDDSGIGRYFNGVFISDDIGLSKPDREYFDYVLDRVDEKDISKILIVGDSLTSDIKGGIDSGIDTCHLNRKCVEYNDISPTYSVRSIDELRSFLIDLSSEVT